jgi:hypothetical protein
MREEKNKTSHLIYEYNVSVQKPRQITHRTNDIYLLITSFTK